ncbi:hypothetical protein [Bordetella holmesii]|uniref:Uncharacterized protein n=2 Tax=Bordetella holmesii TaxID=35814 RepID=A0A158M9W1_9BORD|nr:hypothetical protein [Bordetella holmesii]AHV92830.1 hypothetical protein D560_2772 [Bordetella holmesii ATCC 51541]AIT27406.1 hypothetical protein D558_2750 [Bordetella holmesii 44057]EWM42367.1 hypothetical protein D556_2747 [Bordetella holmesii 41130]EWM47998.1 hypothetical protein D555_2794 [Bordetella holmesii 35009]EWM48976.1 hypothetical protein D557_2044 [Bordetella holmesii 70147]
MSKANVLRLLHLSDTDPALAARLHPLERWGITTAAEALAEVSRDFRLPFSADEARAALASHEGLPLYLPQAGNSRGTKQDPG